MSENEIKEIKESLSLLIKVKAYLNVDKTVMKNAVNAINQLQEENQQLKSQLKQNNDVIDKAKKFVKEFRESFDCYDDVYKDMNILLSILNKRGGTDE